MASVPATPLSWRVSGTSLTGAEKANFTPFFLNSTNTKTSVAMSVAIQQIDLKTLDLFDLQSENTGKALPVGNVKREARGECH